MRFGAHLVANLTPEWNSQYIQYDYMKELLDKAVKAAPIVGENEDHTARDQYFLRADANFFQYCEKQATKVNTFFAEKLAEALRRFATLKDEVRYRKSMYGPIPSSTKLSTINIREGSDKRQSNGYVSGLTQRNQRPSLISPLARILPDRLLKNGETAENIDPMKLKSTHNLKVAFTEFYLMLILLQKFQVLNFTGFRKILKKHDKLFQTTRGEEWRRTFIDTAEFWTSTAVTELIREVETIYIDELEGGDRAQAMKRLRVPPLEEKQSRMVTFRVGIFIGMICVLLPLLIIFILIMDKSKAGIQIDWRVALRLNRSSFLIIMQIIFSSINVYAWSSSGVNHILIFGIDPRYHLTYQQLMEVGTGLCVFWLLSYIAFMTMSYFDFYPYLQPLLFLIVLILFLINPISIFYRPARYWLLKILGRIVTAAFHPILFAEFWLTNQLASLELAFFDLEYFFCFYISDRHWWSTNLTLPAQPQGDVCGHWPKFVLQGFLLAIPSSFRLIQCIRRYYDSKLKFPHLANAGKYSTSVLVAITNSIRRGTSTKYLSDPKRNPYAYPWITVTLISSTYKLIWDLKQDWGLFHKNAGKNKFLRDHLVYSRRIYYYYAIVQDVVFRYLWTINIFIQFNTTTAEYSDVTGFAYGLVEILRRFLWNFFRLENEHLNNCGLFRAVRDISIAPITTGVNFSLIDYKLKQEPGIRRRRNKVGMEKIVEEETGSTTEDHVVNEFVNNQKLAGPSTAAESMHEINATLKDIAASTKHDTASPYFPPPMDDTNRLPSPSHSV